MSQTRTISGPHIRTGKTTRNVMLNVTISLIPALLGAIYFFGIRALYLTGFSVSVCVLAEYIWQKLAKKQVTAGDFSAVVTGILIAFNMPVEVPVWVIAAADIFAILFVKQMFGGIGSNFVNPALMGRLLVMLMWPGTIAKYTAPISLGTDAVSSATVLGAAKNGAEAGYSYFQMFIGEIPGAMGETSALLLLVGFAYLCYMGIVNYEAAFTYIATVLALTFVFGPAGLFTGDILRNLLGGGLILGGCYMLTDYAFTTRKGRLLYALAAGVITAGIRIFTKFPEGVCFGILTANCLAGIISMLYKKHIYGMKKKKLNGENEMKNKNVKGIIALVLVTALSFGVIAGSKALTTDNGENAGSNDNAAEITAELDTTGAEGIENAVKTTKGYEVTVRTAGFAGDILLKVFFDEDAETITKVEVLEHTESEGYGAQIAEAEFLSRFEGVKAPVLLPGMTFGMESGKDEENKDEENNREDNAAKDAFFVDGTYIAVTTEPDDSGYTEELTMVVEGGKITSVVWDCVNAEGEKKSVLSEEGKYVMNPEGLTWKKQAEALAAVVVANQNVASVGMKEDGKTDAVSGVSIYIGGFAGLVEDCMAQAAGTAAETPTEPETPANGTMVDAVSGATVSSKAAINAINNAYKFLQSSGL